VIFEEIDGDSYQSAGVAANIDNRSICNSCGSSLRWIYGRILDGLMKRMAEETLAGNGNESAPRGTVLGTPVMLCV